MDRVKKEKTIDQEIWNTATQIAEDFKPFTLGYHCMFLLLRTKEGGQSSNNDKIHKLISNGTEEFIDNLYFLLSEKQKSPDPLRIYSQVNERDFNKGIRDFKMCQLEADYYDVKSKEDFYVRIRDRFISSLSVPTSKKTSYFIIDCDSTEEHTACLKILADKGLNDLIIKQYPTKNGWHIITSPFNTTFLGDLAPKINKDGLILLAY